MSDAELNKKENILLLILAGINFTHIVDFMIVMPLGPQLMRLFAINPQQFGLIVSVYSISAGVSGVGASFFIDFFDRKNILMFCFSGFLLGTLLCGLAPNYPLLLAARIFTGAFGGLLGGLVLSIVSDVVPFERRASAMGKIMAAFSFASVLGVPLGLYLATQWGWNAPFLFLVLVGLIALALVMVYVPPMRGHLQKSAKNAHPFHLLKNIAQNKNQVLALLFMILLMMGHFSIIPFISPYMVYNVGFSEHDLTYIYLLGGLASLISSPIIGKLADRYGKPKVFTLALLCSLLPITLITHMTHWPLALALLVTSSFFIAAGGRMIPAQAMISATVAPHQRGGFMSINSAVMQLSSGLASFIAGLIVTKNQDGSLLHYENVGYMAVICSLSTLLIVSKLKTVDAK